MPGPSQPEQTTPPATPPTEPKYIVNKRVDRVFVKFAQTRAFIRLQEEMRRHFREKPLLTDKDQEHRTTFFEGRALEEIIRVEPSFWLREDMKGLRFLESSKVKTWYRERDITRSRFDGLLMAKTPEGEQVSAFLEFSLRPSRRKFEAKYAAFTEAKNLRGVLPTAQLIVLVPPDDQKRLKRIEAIAPDIKVRPLPFSSAQFRELLSHYQINFPQDV